MKRGQILKKNIAKRLKRRYFPPSARETGKEYNLISRFSLPTVAPQGRVGENPGNEVGKESSLGQRIKTMVTVD